MRLFTLAALTLILTGCVSAPSYTASTDRQKYIIVSALEAETPGLEAYAPVVYTGVGKVLAAMHLYEAILQYQPGLVINYGTAGAVAGLSGLHQIGTFVERDMDARALNTPRGVVPFSGESLPPARGVVLGTGDSFVNDTSAALEGLDIKVHLVDMEGSALKRVADHLGVTFVSYKYVSDEADSVSGMDWEENVADGANLMIQVLEERYGVSSLK